MTRIAPKTPWYLRPFLKRQKKQYGQELLPFKIWARRPKLLKAFLQFQRAFTLDPVLRKKVQATVADLDQCPFCIDFIHAKTTPENPREEISLRYAQAVIHHRVTDELFAELKKHFTEDEIIELTALTGVQHLSCLFNISLDIPSQHLRHGNPGLKSTLK